MKKTLNKKFVVALAGFLSFGTLSGVAVAINNKISDAQAVSTVLVKRAEVSPNGTQLVNGSLNWAAGTNLSMSSTTYAGKSCAEFSRSASSSRLVYTGPEYTYSWHKCVLTYSLSTSFTGSYMFTFGPLKDQKLSTGNFQTAVFDYTVDSSKDPSMYKNDLTSSTYFGFICSDTSVKLYVYSFEFFEQISQGTVSIASGTGISSAFVSSDPNATSGSTSQKFDIGTNVYGFVTTQAGYTMGSGWTLVSGTAGQAGARWRSAYHDVEEESYNFGTINASLKEYDITWNLGGGSATGLPAKYNKGSGFSTSVEPTKRGYTFLGWTGSNGSTPQKTVSVAAGEIGDKSYTANWELNEYTIKYNNASGVSNPVSYTVETSAFTLDEPSRKACVFAGWTGSQLSTPTKNLELNPSDPGFVLENKEFTATFEYDPLIQPVVDKILAIGGPSNVSYYGSYAALVDAQEAYDELISAHPDFEGAIVEYDELVDDWTAYNALKDAALANAISKIDAIGTVTYPTSKTAIDTARSTFDALEPGDQVSLSSKEATLIAAEEAYASLRSSAIDDVENKIVAIGVVSYPGSYEAIYEVAETAYNALAEEDKSSVSNHNTLVTAKETYESLRIVAINGVIDQIDDLTEHVITLEDEDEIIAARTAYEALAEEDKSSVTNYQDLVDAEARLVMLKEAKAAAQAVDAKINAIGEVTYPGSKDAISSARTAYKALDSAEKIGFVERYETLLAAEARYEELKNAAIQDAHDKIEAIGEISYPASKEVLEAAESAYNALDDADKALVTNREDLVEAREEYNEQKQVNVTIVINIIIQIGDVEYSSDFKAKIDAAQEAYNALYEEQKALVTNYNILVNDVDVYVRIDLVVQKIESIGEVDLSSEESIKAAREAYDALSEEERSLIPNYFNILEKKEQTFTEVKKNQSNPTVAIVLGTIGGVIFLLALAYVLMMFVFNHWIKKNRQAYRVIKLWKNKEGKRVLIATPCKVIHRYDEEVFKTKDEALK